MRKSSILVSISVFLMGLAPSGATAYQETTRDQYPNPVGPYKRTCKPYDKACRADSNLELSGQEGGGIKPKHKYLPGKKQKQDESIDGLERNVQRVLATLNSTGADLGIQKPHPRFASDRGTQAAFCAYGMCDKKAVLAVGQEGGGEPKATLPYTDEILDSPYPWRMYEAKVIGGEDSRELIGPNDTDHAAAVGMVYCRKTVIENGEEKFYASITTGTLVGNTRTLLASAHGLQEKNESGQLHMQYDYAEDCQFRKYREDGRYHAYSFVHAESGGYTGPGDNVDKDWVVLQLDRKAINQKALAVRDLNEDLLTEDSKYPIEVIGYQNDKNDDLGLYHSGGIFRAVHLDGLKLFAHTADTNGRASGATIVHKDSDGVRAVYGIHHGSYLHHDLNKFIPIDSEILEAIRSVMKHKSISI